jgi:hypothetical protein
MYWPTGSVIQDYGSADPEEVPIHGSTTLLNILRDIPEDLTTA